MNDRTLNLETTVSPGETKSRLLTALGQRLRTLRARRGLTRKSLAMAADISERYLASLEHGIANPSILILDQISRALQCSMAELLGDVTASSPEWLLIRELLEGRDETALRQARVALSDFVRGNDGRDRRRRVALIGLRGAGKSTVGPLLAEDLEWPFIELRREIEKIAGYNVREIHDLYGTNAYRRYERRALEETIQIYPEVVLATPGGLVSDPASFNTLLDHCTTVWLQANPEDHMRRVTEQGDLRPMAASKEAMEDLRRILTGRTAFYSKADLTVDTSQQPLVPTFELLRARVRETLRLPA